MVFDRGGVLVIDDPLSLLSAILWLAALGTWPVGFLFGACSPCCQQQCPWILEFDRCLRVSIVGSDPPDGGDCRIVSSRAGTGDVEYMTSTFLQIHHVQSRIRITVRLSLSASGTSRTPVGETRTQVWRFNRATPTSPVQSTYDVLGPPWHLQVDVSVTGVATQAEAGVVSSLETDEHGQPKLVLTVNQWTATITHDESVTLFPVGLQRWGPGLSGTQSFRLSSTSVTATLSSGTSYAGWSVSKLTGLTIEERKLAVRFPAATLCFTMGTMVQRVFLDDEAAVDFVRGDGTLRVPATVSEVTTDRDLRILPNNAICQLSRDLLNIGIALGIYPEFLSATAPESYEQTFPRETTPGPVPRQWCGPNPIAMHPSGTLCLSSWATTYSRRNMASFAAITASVSSFYSGRTLLWNSENGPYRTSFVTDRPGIEEADEWTVSIDGNPQVSVYDAVPFSCPSGTSSIDRRWSSPSFPVSNLIDLCTPSLAEESCSVDLTTGVEGEDCSLIPGVSYVATVNYEAQVEVLDSAEPFNLEPPPGNCEGGGPRFTTRIEHISGPIQVLMFRERVFVEGGKVKVEFLGARNKVLFLGQSASACGNVGHTPHWVTVFVSAKFEVPCDAEGDLESPEANIELSYPGAPVTPNFPVQPQSLILLWTIPFQGVQTLKTLTTEVTGTYDGPAVPFTAPRRRICSNWSLDAVPASGATITRTCGDQFGGADPGSGNLSLTYGNISRTRLPRLIGGFTREGTDSIIREGSCVLRGLAAQGTSTNTNNPLASPIFLSGTQGTCYYYALSFGSVSSVSSDDAPLCDAPVIPTSLPCGGCAVSVAVLSGQENASVRYVESGDKAGLIEIIAKRTWLGGQGVTFTVSCGGDTITQVVRRADTVPTPPQNLTVVRGPCSEAFLQWEAPEWNGGQPITAYSVQFRRIGVTAWTTLGTVSPPSLSSTVTGLVRVGYEFRVFATNSVGTSTQSNIAVDGFALGAPTNLTFTRDPCDQVQLSWTPPAQTECVVVAAYRLEYRVGVTGTFLTFGTVAGTQTTGTITGLDPTLRYQFRVARVADAGGDLFSEQITSGSVPAVPTGVAAALGAEPGEVDVTWSANELLCFENTDYLVQFRPSTTFTWSDFARAASTDKFATVTGLTPATYFFRVRATNSLGNSGFSSQSNSVTIPEPE